MVHLSISEYQHRPCLKMYGSFCNHSDVQHVEGVDDHQTAQTSNRIIQGQVLASRVLFLEMFNDFFFSFTLRRGLKVIFTLMTCSSEIKTTIRGRLLLLDRFKDNRMQLVSLLCRLVVLNSTVICCATDFREGHYKGLTAWLPVNGMAAFNGK